MAGITDRKLFSDGQRFFFRGSGGVGLLSKGTEAGEHALQSEGNASFCGTRVALPPVVDDRMNRLSDGFLSDRWSKRMSRWLACPAAMTDS